MRKLLIGAAVVAGSLGIASTASAKPPQVLQYICENAGPVEVEVRGGSRVATVDGVRYKAIIFDINAPGFTYVKTFGSVKDQNHPDRDVCVSPDGVERVTIVPA